MSTVRTRRTCIESSQTDKTTDFGFLSSLKLLNTEALAEIEGLEALIPDGNTMEIAVGDADVLRVPLDDYRAALGAINACLSTL